jgi:glutamine synthetase
MFDGSSISGWKGINESDMVLMPDADHRRHRSVLREQDADRALRRARTEHHGGLQPLPALAGQARRGLPQVQRHRRRAYFGPEPEFFVFDDVRFEVDMHGCSYDIDSEEGAWNTGDRVRRRQHRASPGVKGGYFPGAAGRSLYDLRGTMCRIMEAMGVQVEVHHHEVGTAGQCEIGTRFDALVRKADEMLILKYVVHNVAHRPARRRPSCPSRWSATTVPACTCTSRSPRAARTCSVARATAAVGNGLPLHRRHLQARPRHQCLRQFHDQQLQAPGARLRGAGHAGLLGAQPFRLLPHSLRQQSEGAPHRGPLRRSGGQQYLIFAAMLMAGLDGVRNKIDPGAPMDKDLYDLPPEEEKLIPTVCSSLDQAWPRWTPTGNS